MISLNKNKIIKTVYTIKEIPDQDHKYLKKEAKKLEKGEWINNLTN
jgi:hypothetical protein